FRSVARSFNDADVKKLVGLSRAELTFLPVARRFCVMLIRSAVFCSDSRFWRMPAERVMLLDMGLTNLSGPIALPAKKRASSDHPDRCQEPSHRKVKNVVNAGFTNAVNGS